MKLDVIGGDVRVIATLDEITRVSARLRQAEERCREALSVIDWTLNPEVALRLRLIMVAEECAQLAARCVEAREHYYDLEVGNASMIARSGQLATGALDHFTGPTGANPFLGGFRFLGALSLTVGAGVAGGLWGNGASQVNAVRAAVQFAPRAIGSSGPQSMLQRVIFGLDQLGIRTETASYVVPGPKRPSQPANTIREHVQRLVLAYHNPASSVTIESYQTAQGRQFVAYVPGTQSAGLGNLIKPAPGKQNNPLDMRSNFNAMAAPGLAASENALRLALQSAGAGGQPGDRVLFVAHSQGAMVSANLASTDQRYQVSGLISIAGPIAHLNLDGVPTLALEHSDDPVPALSGSRNPLTLDLVTVRAPSGQEGLIAAHAIDGYGSLAEAVDSSENPAVKNLIERIGATEASSGSSQSYLLRRTDSAASEQTNGGVLCAP